MKKVISFILLIVLVFSLFTTTASAVETNPEGTETNQSNATHIGSYYKDALTGEVTFIPSAIDYSRNSVDVENTAEYNPVSEDSSHTVSPFAIMGEDNRIKIDNPQNYGQYRNTVYIQASTASGKWVRGTGFMLGPNTVATCGHLLYNKEFGGDYWVTSALVIPARREGSPIAPYGNASAIAYECGGNWANNEDYDDDWGIIRLNTNIGDSVGWLGLRTQQSSYNNTSVMVNGYPEKVRNVETYALHRSDGTINVSKARSLISYSVDATGGNSGGPCYVWSDTHGYQAIGLLQSGGVEPNTHTTFLRIDEWIFNKFASYISARA